MHGASTLLVAYMQLGKYVHGNPSFYLRENIIKAVGVLGMRNETPYMHLERCE